jgi:hypothetical protein
VIRAINSDQSDHQCSRRKREWEMFSYAMCKSRVGHTDKHWPRHSKRTGLSNIGVRDNIFDCDSCGWLSKSNFSESYASVSYAS